MNETGSYPGQVWLWLYTFWYQISPFNTSDNADAEILLIMMVLSLAFVCIPFIPGVRSLPRYLGVHRLIWRDHYRRVEGRALARWRRERNSPPRRRGGSATDRYQLVLHHPSTSSSSGPGWRELEHGLQIPQTDVTGDDPIITGKIALAHLNEFPDYYTRLEAMEEQAKRDRGSADGRLPCCEPTTAVVALWYRLLCPMCLGGPRPGTMGTRGTPTEASTPEAARLGAGRSYHQAHSVNYPVAGRSEDDRAPAINRRYDASPPSNWRAFAFSKA